MFIILSILAASAGMFYVILLLLTYFVIIYFFASSTNKYIKIIYHFLKSLPCLFNDLMKNLNKTTGNTGKISGIILLCLLAALLLPCIIRYFYLRTPWGLPVKTSYIEKINNAEKAINSLEENINQRKLMVPEIQWTETWIEGASAEDKKIMRAELIKLGYRNYNEKWSDKIKNSIRALAKCYVSLDYPFIPTYNLRGSLNKILTPPKMKLEDTVKYIKANSAEMQADLKLLPKLKFNYETLVNGYEKYAAVFKTKQLINEPIYTDHETTSPDWYFENLKDGKHYNYSYAVSAWFFIHEHPPNHKPSYNNFTSLFNYGDKPNILYNMKKQMLRITIRNNNKKDQILFETKELPMQKWNNIVINYDKGTLDLYINNKMVASEPKIIPYLSQDKITIGQKNGLSGGICNVIYFPQALSLTKIGLFYQTLKNFSTPVLPNCIF